MPSLPGCDLDINSDKTHFPTLSWHKSPNQVGEWKDKNEKDLYFKTVSPCSSNGAASNSSRISESPLINLNQDNVKIGKHSNFSKNPLLCHRAPRIHSKQDYLPLPQQNDSLLRHYSGTIYPPQTGCLLPPYYQTPITYYPTNSAPLGPTQYYLGLPSYYDQAQASGQYQPFGPYSSSGASHNDYSTHRPVYYQQQMPHYTSVYNQQAQNYQRPYKYKSHNVGVLACGAYPPIFSAPSRNIHMYDQEHQPISCSNYRQIVSSENVTERTSTTITSKQCIPHSSLNHIKRTIDMICEEPVPSSKNKVSDSRSINKYSDPYQNKRSPILTNFYECSTKSRTNNLLHSEENQSSDSIYLKTEALFERFKKDEYIREITDISSSASSFSVDALSVHSNESVQRQTKSCDLGDIKMVDTTSFEKQKISKYRREKNQSRASIEQRNPSSSGRYIENDNQHLSNFITSSDVLLGGNITTSPILNSNDSASKLTNIEDKVIESENSTFLNSYNTRKYDKKSVYKNKTNCKLLDNSKGDKSRFSPQRNNYNNTTPYNEKTKSLSFGSDIVTPLISGPDMISDHSINRHLRGQLFTPLPHMINSLTKKERSCSISPFIVRGLTDSEPKFSLSPTSEIPHILGDVSDLTVEKKANKELNDISTTLTACNNKNTHLWNMDDVSNTKKCKKNPTYIGRNHFVEDYENLNFSAISPIYMENDLFCKKTPPHKIPFERNASKDVLDTEIGKENIIINPNIKYDLNLTQKTEKSIEYELPLQVGLTTNQYISSPPPKRSNILPSPKFHQHKLESTKKSCSVASKYYRSIIDIPPCFQSNISLCNSNSSPLILPTDLTRSIMWGSSHHLSTNCDSPLPISIVSKGMCIPLKPPIPLKFQGEIEKMMTVNIPEFSNLVNFPSDKHSMTLPERMRKCVMCGQICPCSVSNKNMKNIGKKITTSENSRVLTKLGSRKNNHVNATTSTRNMSRAIIPRQNKGLCTNCDTNVWVVTESDLEIKWCKGCKNFRPWAAFGDKGFATKCVRCRERQREKYASQKEEREKSKEFELKNNGRLLK